MSVHCSFCPESVRQFCRAYFKFLWRFKGLFLLVCCTLYVTVYIGVYTITTARRLPPGKPLLQERLDLSRIPVNVAYVTTLRNFTGVKTRLFEGTKALTQKELDIEEPVINFTFTRNDLRLAFKPLPYINPTNPIYDNVADYPCVQSEVVRRNLGFNDTEDIMCLPRPQYLPNYKNPCYKDAASPHNHLGNIHCLPYFHVLGLDKCGTTDFHSRLTSHPQVLLNNGGIGKEIYYWCWLRYGLWMKGNVPKRRFRGYITFFHVPSVRIVNEYMNTRQQMITGDGTPMDFWDFRGWQEDPQNWGLPEPRVLTPHAMRHMYRNPKFIVLVRNPVDRLYSDYIFLGYGFSPQKFAVDVPVAIAMIRDCLRVNTTRQCFFSDEMYHKLPMRIHISCYSVFFREWLSVFHKSHFFVLRTEDYHADMVGSLRKAFEFLEVESLSTVELRRIASQQIKHETVMKKKAGPMFAQTRALLEEFFASFNEDLAMMLNDERFLWKDSVTSQS